MGNSAVVIGADALALTTTDQLRSRGVEVQLVRRDQLADLSVSLGAAGFQVEGRSIGAVLLREPVGGIAATSFVEEDRGFVSAELSATWLAGAQLGAVRAINCFDAESWFDDGWSVWNRRLRAASLEMSPLSFGDCDSASYWRPYCGGGDRPAPTAAVRRALGTALATAPLSGEAVFACGNAVGRQPPPNVLRASRLLRGGGVQLKSISYDRAGRITAVDAFPAVVDGLVEPVARHLTDAFCEHLRSW